ncbi:MAG: transposase [Desulfobacterales bacterium]
MKSISEKRNRRLMRLKSYDYSKDGAYFVTICVQKKECLLGQVVDGVMELNDAGKTIGHAWSDLPSRYASAELDEVVIMPNHIHGIIVINDTDVGAGLALPNKGAASGAPTLGDIVRVFKSISTRNVNRLLSRLGQPVWQRNYFDRIIRNEDELNRIRQYIANNPLQWQIDRENPATEDVNEKEEEPWGAKA